MRKSGLFIQWYLIFFWSPLFPAVDQRILLRGGLYQCTKRWLRRTPLEGSRQGKAPEPFR